MTMKPLFIVYRFAFAWREALKKMMKRLLSVVAVVVVMVVCVWRLGRARRLLRRLCL